MKSGINNAIRYLLLLLIGFSLLRSSASSAAAGNGPPGTLDPSFGQAGKVVTDISSTDAGYAITVRPDGKILLAGFANDGFGLAQYKPDGSLDSSFGSNGIVTTSFFNNKDSAFGIVLQPDGKVILAGMTSTPESQDDFAMARYNTDGSLDPSFDTDGKVNTDFGGTERANAITLQSGGKIVVAGYRGNNDNDFRPVVARYNADGSLDSSFDQDGKLVLPFTHGSRGYALLSDQNGRILVAGEMKTQEPFDYDVMVFRLQPDGSLDPTFGSNGLVTTDFNSIYDHASAIAVQKYGKLVIAGSSYTDNIILARYNDNGSLDQYFGENGKVIANRTGSRDSASTIALQADGKTLVGGSSYTSTSQWDFILTRFKSDGNLDQSFGTAGVAVTDFGGVDHAYSMVLQINGFILLGGVTDANFAMARYINDGQQWFHIWFPIIQNGISR
jgi:uncharacterized delta-60 repeat protein